MNTVAKMPKTVNQTAAPAEATTDERYLVPGLARAEFQRLGQVHRNTFVDAPRVLAADQRSQLDVPTMDNTQMDGYAVRAVDCASGNASRGRLRGMSGYSPRCRIMSRTRFWRRS